MKMKPGPVIGEKAISCDFELSGVKSRFKVKNGDEITVTLQEHTIRQLEHDGYELERVSTTVKVEGDA